MGLYTYPPYTDQLGVGMETRLEQAQLRQRAEFNRMRELQLQLQAQGAGMQKVTPPPEPKPDKRLLLLGRPT